MSKRQLRIHIPEPCHERWDRMTPTEKGAFCQSCDKEVMDFTGLSDDEVAYFFRHNNEGKTCGRFRNTQLDRALAMPPELKQKRFWVNALWFAPLALFGKTAFGQSTTTSYILLDKPPRCLRVDTAPQVQFDTMRLEHLERTEYMTLGQTIAYQTFDAGPADTVEVKTFYKWRVINAHTKAPLPLARIKAGDREFVSDSLGEFSFTRTESDTIKSLTVMLDGFMGRFLNLDSLAPDFNGDIELEPLFTYVWNFGEGAGPHVNFLVAGGVPVVTTGTFIMLDIPPTVTTTVITPVIVAQEEIVAEPEEKKPDYQTYLQNLSPATPFVKQLTINTPWLPEKKTPPQQPLPKQKDQNGILPAGSNDKKKRS